MPEALSLPRRVASDAVAGIGWRYLLGDLCTSVPVQDLADAARVAVAAVDACGADADGHLQVDLRADRVELRLRDRTSRTAGEADVTLARAVTDALFSRGHVTAAAGGPDDRRTPEQLEIAVDTTDAAAVRPFWRAVFGYADESDGDAWDGLVDPVGQHPTVWFQRMDQARTERNRIHFDVTVPHDEADRRIRAALDAGGRLVSDAEARAFWILADRDGNEVCICTWEDRDRWG